MIALYADLLQRQPGYLPLAEIHGWSIGWNLNRAASSDPKLLRDCCLTGNNTPTGGRDPRSWRRRRPRNSHQGHGAVADIGSQHLGC